MALGMSEDALWAVLRRCRETLFNVRSKRVLPGLDEKVLAEGRSFGATLEMKF